jgi:hypothetical protein
VGKRDTVLEIENRAVFHGDSLGEALRPISRTEQQR